MEDIGEKLGELLGNEELMEKLRGIVGESLGGEENPSDENSGGDNPLGALSGILGSLNLGGENDPTINLLQALIPFLSDERKLKAREAEKLVRLTRLLPLIKDSGIFKDLL